MDFKKFVTEYDENLSGDAYIDPLGVLVIWSAFGQEIFHNRVNSISNDIRNYTLNLFNHRLIRDLIDDDSVVVGKWLETAIGDKNSLSFRQACLIYLENLFSYAMMSTGTAVDVDTGGILGNAKARTSLEATKGDPVLELGNRKQAQLLVRQLGLGVSGRYKTPFMEIGFFDSNYHYHLPKATPLWEESNRLFERSQLLNRLYKEARNHLTKLINGCTLKSQVPLTLHFSEIPSSLVQAYRRTLRSPAQVGTETRKFWLDLTGLSQGTAGALLEVLDEQAELKADQPLTMEALFSFAKKRCKDDREADKVTNIMTLEPLLAETDLLFTLARHRRNQSVAEIEELWRNLGRDENTLPDAADRVRAIPDIPLVLTGTGRKRFDKILAAASLPAFEDQLRDLLAYHCWVMRQRDQFPWVDMTPDGRVRVNARTEKMPRQVDRPLGHWVNSYYIPQFKNLLAGLRGLAA